jgi:cellulose synthase/poly-beta-1,6-N-acetylglucosamine synthase-like glycosyltransferase
MEIAFWVLIGIIGYVYCGYPLLLLILPKRAKKTQGQTNYTPTVTLIIAAYNEEKTMREKLKNTLKLDYPEDSLQIIVASDASTDKTDDIVREYASYGIVLNRQDKRRGKSAMLNDTVLRLAKGEILVFSDATTILKQDAIKRVVENFSDPKVGAVCARIVFVNAADSFVAQSEGLYWRYEEKLRDLEGQVGVLPFVSGAFYGLRKELYMPVAPHLPDDSVSPLGVLEKGYYVVFEPEAIAYEKGPTTWESEFRVKSRGVVRELASILSFKSLLNPLRHPIVCLSLFCHRLLRWSVSLCLASAFVVNFFLVGEPLYTVTFGLQITFYFLAAIGYLSRRRPKQPRLLFLPFYYLMVNLAALWGIAQFIYGKRQATWQPVAR